MAKKKESIYNDWDEVNLAMKELGELTIKKQKIEGEQTLKINEIKAEYQVKAGDLVNQIKEIEKNIERFSEQNKSDFLKSRSKKLSFGTISYRMTKRVVCKYVETAINALKSLNMDFCLRIKEELNKDALIEVEDKSLLQKAGISVVPEDKIRIEPDFVKLAALEKGE